MVQARAIRRCTDGGKSRTTPRPNGTRLGTGATTLPPLSPHPYETANFNSLIALKSDTSPPTRLVA